MYAFVDFLFGGSTLLRIDRDFVVLQDSSDAIVRSEIVRLGFAFRRDFEQVRVSNWNDAFSTLFGVLGLLFESLDFY